MATIEAVREKPILMSGPMVKAVQADRKTQTRRVVKPPVWWSGMTHYATGTVDASGHTMTNMVLCEKTAEHWQYCPYGTPGGRLWVRETWAEEYGMKDETGRDPDAIWYRADGQARFCDISRQTMTGDTWDAGTREAETQVATFSRWRPSIFMPRWASRITLELTAVRVERLNDISEPDALAEGGWTYGTCPIHKNPERSFAELWDSINGKRPGCRWADNPWVWALSLRRLDEKGPRS